MAAKFTAADATDKLALSDWLPGFFPVSFSLWYKQDSLATSYQTIFGWDDGANQWALLGTPNIGGSRRVAWDNTSNGTLNYADPGVAQETSNWHNAVVTITDGTNRACYVDNTKGTNGATVNWFTNETSRYVGNDGYGDAFDGKVAELGIWDVALTDAEAALLSKGYSPLFVRPQNLIFYAPLIRDFVDLISKTTITNTGVTVADHPRIIRPAPQRARRFTSAAGGGTTINVSPVTIPSAVVSPAVSLAFAIAAQAITSVVNAPALAMTMAVSPVAAAFVVNAPTVSLTRTIAIDPVVLTADVVAPAIAMSIAPAPVEIPSVVVAPTVTTGILVSPDPVAIVAVVNAPSVALSFAQTPVTIPSVVNAPTVATGVIVQPDPVAIPSVVNAPAVALSIAQSPIVLTFVVNAPAVSLSYAVDPIAVPAAVVSPSVSLAIALLPLTLTATPVSPGMQFRLSLEALVLLLVLNAPNVTTSGVTVLTPLYRLIGLDRSVILARGLDEATIQRLGLDRSAISLKGRD